MGGGNKSASNRHRGMSKSQQSAAIDQFTAAGERVWCSGCSWLRAGWFQCLHSCYGWTAQQAHVYSAVPCARLAKLREVHLPFPPPLLPAEVGLLLATAAGEQGLDFPNCEFVVRWVPTLTQQGAGFDALGMPCASLAACAWY